MHNCCWKCQFKLIVIQIPNIDNADKYFVSYLIAENVAIETANTAGKETI